jgi:hypothetical protein
VRRINRVLRSHAILLAVAVVCAAAGANVTRAATRPLVVVVRHGGLCVTGSECRSTFRITDATISGDGYRSRALSAAQQRSMIAAIHDLDAGYLRKHPFNGTCPIAYDGTEAIYRFRGFVPSIPACKYDVRGIRAVRLTERLLATLKPR